MPHPSCHIPNGMGERFTEYKSEGILRHFGIAFGLALLCYILFYSCDHHLRLRKGPWELNFSSETDGTPKLIINQPKLGIANVTVRLEGEAVQQKPALIRFTGPGVDIPYGKILFFDTTYLPGTVTFDLFGHEVEIMSRTLILNFEEHPWQSGEVVSLKSEQKWRAVATTNQLENAPLSDGTGSFGSSRIGKLKEKMSSP
ncbi:MAG: hypothetical protein M2R45_01214 [Verrucomicrobia subdivision 3 bacterium]|nr:hypothetical protein [Limisphaerales bacterium]MCS1415234.1 hypothetical protein [Limisphaerales bacterium]